MSSFTCLNYHLVFSNKHRQLLIEFQEEFVELLRRHEIEYDERYVWD